jgi:hypothetical protein
VVNTQDVNGSATKAVKAGAGFTVVNGFAKCRRTQEIRGLEGGRLFRGLGRAIVEVASFSVTPFDTYPASSTVELVLRKLAEGATEAELLQDYPHLTTEDVRAAVAYGAACVALDAGATTNLV